MKVPFVEASYTLDSSILKYQRVGHLNPIFGFLGPMCVWATYEPFSNLRQRVLYPLGFGRKY